MKDNSKIVRWKALHTLPHYWHAHRLQFWQTVFERSEIEQDAMCLQAIVRHITYDDMMKENQLEVEKAATILIQRLSEDDYQSVHEVWEFYVVLILKLIIKRDSVPALKIVHSNLNNKSFTRRMIFEIYTVMDPHSPINNYVSDPSKYEILVNLIEKAVDHSFHSINKIGLKNEMVKDYLEIVDNAVQHLYFTISEGRRENKGKVLLQASKAAFFNKFKPLLNYIKVESEKVESGFMVAHTGYYFMQLLNNLLEIDAEYALELAVSIVRSASASGFTHDSTTLSEVVTFTEKILADHKYLLSNSRNLNYLLTIFDLFANSGWQEALELSWRIKEAF